MRFVKSILGAALFATATAGFTAPAIDLSSPGSQYGGGSWTLGFEFSVSGAQSIDALGVYDNLGDGLSAPASIGLWDMSGNLLTSTTIGAGSGTLEGLFRYAAITPYLLAADTHYIVGAYATDLASSLSVGQGGSGTINSLVTIHQDRYGSASSLAFPYSTGGSTGGAWLGANFNLTSAVPEPATWAMMILGMGAVGASMRRRTTSTVRFA